MKKALLSLTILLLMAGCTKPQQDNPVVGGWTQVEDKTVTEDLQKIFDQAMEKESENYTAIELLETQLVAGTNYKFLSETEDKKQVIVTIYADLQGNAEVTDIEELK